MSSVRNLLAMFENGTNKGETQPPERGRSPGGGPPAPSSSAASGTESPRPLSKIRTSFVAIEKDGRIGLTRDQSGGSSVSRRRMSIDTEAGAIVPPDEKLPTSTEHTTMEELSQEPAPESLQQSTSVSPTDIAATKGPSGMRDRSPATTPPATETKGEVAPSMFLPSTVVPSVETVPVENTVENHTVKLAEKLTQKVIEAPTTKLKQIPLGHHPTEDVAVKLTEKAIAAPREISEMRLEHHAGKSADSRKDGGKAKMGEIAEPSKKGHGKAGPKLEPKKDMTRGKATEKKTSSAGSAKQSPTLAPISTTKTNMKATKSPIVAKTPADRVPAKSPAPPHDRRAVTTKATGVVHPEKPRGGPPRSHAEKEAHQHTSRTIKTTRLPVRPGATSSSLARKAAPTSITTSPPATGFSKPKPKSPTKPLKLPASLMASTASSVHKTGTGARQTQSRTGHYAPSHTGNTRSPSRASIGAPSAHANPARPLRRQSSSTTRLRPSIGPPPKQMGHDHPPARKEKEVDEGFLARMMRPTQASAQKVHEKTQLPTTPPRKPHSTNRVSDHGVPPMHKLSPAKKSPTSRRSTTPHAEPAMKMREPATATPPRPSSLSMTPSGGEEDEQPTSARTDELGDDTLVEKGDSPTRKVKETNVQNVPLVVEAELASAFVPKIVETLPTPVEPAYIHDAATIKPNDEVNEPGSGSGAVLEEALEEDAPAPAEAAAPEPESSSGVVDSPTQAKMEISNSQASESKFIENVDSEEATASIEAAELK